MNTSEKQLINSNQQRQGRKIFLLMTIFFVTPIIVVIAMYKLNWKPTGQSNGDLFVPARKVVETIHINSVKQTNKEINNTDNLWKDKWSMVYLADNCGKDCEDRLHIMRQIHVSLYKDIPRMQRVLVTNQKELGDIKSRYPDLIILNQQNSSVDALYEQFKVDQEQSKKANRIYLVDPLGYLIVSYRPSIEGKAILKDISRLLKYAWAG